ncbi:MAG: lamin tail domain-containing protein [Myxococcota bacterium]
MANPDAGQAGSGEYIEIENRGAETLDLFGARLSVGANSYTIDTSIVLDPGEVALIARSSNPARNGDLPIVHDTWTSISLPDSGGTILLSGSDGTLLDAVTYTAGHGSGGFVPDGASMSLDPDAPDNDTATYWCDGRSAFGDGDFGTPGSPNEDCDYAVCIDFRYDLDNGDAPAEDDVTGSTTLEFDYSAFARTFTTGNGGEGVYTRGTSAGDQDLWLQYAGTGVQYIATRASGTDEFSGGVMDNLPAGVTSGSWDVVACP